MRILKKILVITMIIGFYCCTESTENTEPFDLDSLNGKWILDKVILKEDNETITDIDAEITFSDENTISFNSCNSGHGKFENNDNIIMVDQLPLTKVACSYDETIVSNNLSGEYSIDGDSLKIISSNNTELYFSKTSEDSTDFFLEKLNGTWTFDKLFLENDETIWTIDKLIEEQNNDKTYNDFRSPIIIFEDENIINFESCNRGKIEFEINDNIVTVNRFGITEVFCPYDETIIVNNLSGEYSIDGDSLKIISTNSTELYFFR